MTPNPTNHTNQKTPTTLTQNFMPDSSERPVAEHTLCRLTANMFQQPGPATYPRSAQPTSS